MWLLQASAETAVHAEKDWKAKSKLKYYGENFVNIVNQYEKCEAEASEQADWADSLAIPGEVYFADTKGVLPDLKKVGGTSKTGPERVRTLSTAGVPEPYVCYRSIAVKDWRLMEKCIHEYFKEARVYPGKEFFLLSDKDVDTICDAIEGKVQMSYKERANWTFSVRVVRERLDKGRKKRLGTMQENDVDDLDTVMDGGNIREQERVMAENPRDFNRELAYDTGDDDDAGGSAQMPRGRCSESLKRPAEIPVSPPAKRCNYGEANAMLKLKDVEINVLKTSMAKDAEIISALKTSMAKDAEINELKTSMAAKDIEARDNELSKAIDARDTALSAAADAKKHAQQVEADKDNEIRALTQKLDAATAEINRRKTIEETVQVVKALAVEAMAKRMEVWDEAVAKRMEVWDEAMEVWAIQEMKVSNQQYAEKEAECQKLRKKDASDAATHRNIMRKAGNALKAVIKKTAAANRKLEMLENQEQLVRRILQATSGQRQVDYFAEFKGHINNNYQGDEGVSSSPGDKETQSADDQGDGSASSSDDDDEESSMSSSQSDGSEQ